jgi:hypothetical protein
VPALALDYFYQRATVSLLIASTVELIVCGDSRIVPQLISRGGSSCLVLRWADMSPICRGAKITGLDDTAAHSLGSQPCPQPV